MYKDVLMQRAVATSVLARAGIGTEHFGSVIVKSDKIVGERLNHSKAKSGPISHRNIEATGNAGGQLECVDPSDCTPLYVL